MHNLTLLLSVFFLTNLSLSIPAYGQDNSETDDTNKTITHPQKPQTDETKDLGIKSKDQGSSVVVKAKELREKREKEKLEKKRLKEEKAKQKASCEKAKAYLKSYQRPRVTVVVEDGSYRRIGEEEREDKIAQGQKLVNEACNNK